MMLPCCKGCKGMSAPSVAKIKFQISGLGHYIHLMLEEILFHQHFCDKGCTIWQANIWLERNERTWRGLEKIGWGLWPNLLPAWVSKAFCNYPLQAFFFFIMVGLQLWWLFHCRHWFESKNGALKAILGIVVAFPCIFFLNESLVSIIIIINQSIEKIITDNSKYDIKSYFIFHWFYLNFPWGGGLVIIPE